MGTKRVGGRNRKLAASKNLLKSISREIRASTPDLRCKQEKLKEEAMQLQDSIFILRKRLEEAPSNSGEARAITARKTMLEEKERHLLVEITLCEKLTEHFGSFGKR